MRTLLFSLMAAGLVGATAHAEVKVTTVRNAPDAATAGYQFAGAPGPAKNDAASGATFTLVDGVRDRNGGSLAKLHDGALPAEADQPAENFFFNQGTAGGRVQIDLGRVIEVQQLNTYSWHPGARGPQVFRLYASDGLAAGFQAAPKRDVAPTNAGWALIASVDTRPKEGEPGGQYVSSVADSSGALGRFRYLLLEVQPTSARDVFGQTFFSEIDVVERNGPALIAAGGATTNATPITKSFTAGEGRYHFTLNATVAPDLMEWADTQLRPVVQEWYPRLVDLLPSEGFRAPTNVTIRFRDNMGTVPASAGGGYINCNAGWFRRELKREALGSVVHEMVHVVQSYGSNRRGNPNATRTPGWIVEGIPDYVRWFLYEPQTRGAEITRRNLEKARYDASYRVSGNFFDWVSRQYDSNIVVKVNAAARQSRYTEELWKSATGKSLAELGEEWKKAAEAKIIAAEAAREAAKPAAN